MSTRLQVGILSAAIALSMVGLAFSQEPAAGQAKAEGKGKGAGKGKGGGRAAPTGPTPRMPDGKPDLSGLWFRPYTPNMASGPAKDNRGGDPSGPKELPFTPLGKAQWDKYEAGEGDYTGACLPFGLMLTARPFEEELLLAAAHAYEQATNWHTRAPADG